MSRESSSEAVTAVVLDERVTFTLDEVCRMARLQAGSVISLVDEGVLEPRGGSPAQWRFPAQSLGRLRTAARLQSDLGLNLAGVALALELLDELRRLRSRTEALESMLGGGAEDF